MYQFKDEIDQKALFWFDREWIDNHNWAKLQKASKAIFPVIACHAGKDGCAFPAEQTIAIKSGLSDKIVRGGIRGLKDFPRFHVEDYVTRRGRRSKKFSLALQRRLERGTAFPFFKSIIESGRWREASPTAKSLRAPPVSPTRGAHNQTMRGVKIRLSLGVIFQLSFPGITGTD